MLKAMKPPAAEWYTPLAEQGKEAPTRFRLRGLTGIESFDGRPKRDPEDGGWYFTTASGKAMLRLCLLGWENFGGESGPLEFNRADPDANIEAIDVYLASELVNRIYGLTVLSEAERKNSSSPST